MLHASHFDYCRNPSNYKSENSATQKLAYYSILTSRKHGFMPKLLVATAALLSCISNYMFPR